MLIETEAVGLEKVKHADSLRLAAILRSFGYRELHPTVMLDGYFVRGEVAELIPPPCLDHVCGTASKRHPNFLASRSWNTSAHTVDGAGCRHVGEWR